VIDPKDFAIHRNLYYPYTELENESRPIHPVKCFPIEKKPVARSGYVHPVRKEEEHE
jgi:hypothetical protein